MKVVGSDREMSKWSQPIRRWTAWSDQASPENAWKFTVGQVVRLGRMGRLRQVGEGVGEDLEEMVGVGAATSMRAVRAGLRLSIGMPSWLRVTA